MICDSLKKNKHLTMDAVICGEDRITYQELYHRANILGKEIMTAKSESVVLFIPNSIYYVTAFYAVLFAGKILYPISSLSKESEIICATDQTNSKLVLCTSKNSKLLNNILGDTDIKIICVDEEDLFTNKSSCQELFNSNLNNMNDICTYLNTSGSTSIHKIVMLTQKNIETNCNDWIEAALDPSSHGKILVAMPACTSFGTIVISTCILLGWEIVFIPSFLNSANILDTIEREKITHLICIGSMLNILASDILNLDSQKESSLQFIGIGGNKAVPQTMKILMSYFPNAGISPGYGISEATCIVTAIHPEVSLINKELFIKKIDSAGIPFKNSHINILELDDITDGVGEILISGPTVMAGYYNNVEATQQAIRDEYLHTGDLGYLDEDGYLYIIGRIKNIIKSGGYTIFPEEVENVLENLEIVRTAYVYGVKDDVLDERIVADIIPTSDNEDVTEIINYCIGQLSSYKVPSEIRIVNEVKRTKNGKIQRKVFTVNV